MGFEVHSDVAGHPAIEAAGDSGFVVWLRCGHWTARNGRTGIVPREVAEEIIRPRPVKRVIGALVASGLWTDLGADGFRMEYGPGNDWPLPLWRYGDEEITPGRMFEIIPDPDA